MTSAKPSRVLTALLSLATLSACGGGSSPAAPAATQTNLAAVTAASTTTAPVASGDNIVAGSASGQSAAKRNSTLTPTAPAPTSGGTVITDVKFESIGLASQSAAPVTFGQVFVQGALPSTQSLVGKLADGTTVPLQLDVKAKHADGSVRHAVISAVLPTVTTSALSMNLVTQAPYASNTPVAPAALLTAGFTSSASVTVGGTAYTVSADTLLKNGKFTNWLSGPIVNEWHVSAPLTTAGGVAHPHLTARFAIRSYTGSKKTRVDVTVENAWAYEANPQNFTYDTQFVVGGKPVFTKTGMTHYHHARWRKLGWWGGDAPVHVKHNSKYLMATKAVPNYDSTIVFPETTLAALASGWAGAKTEPMGVGMANPAMAAGGGRPDIGLNPGWAVTYLLSMDKRAKDVTTGTADLAGSWSSHYRNKNTDRPVSLMDYPYMTILGNRGDTGNPATGKLEAFPLCATTTACTSPNAHDTSHQPNFAFVPYIVTGDYYYLEELQFWAMWNSFSSNPHYREFAKGLMKANEVRSQAWGLRSLAEAAYITPDTDPLKAQFNYFVGTNLDWYNANYTNNTAANKLGVIINGYAVVYANATGLAPWQDDFFTSAVGRTYELGFTAAKPLLDWKAKFGIARMTDPAACWIDASIYAMKIRDSETAPIYTSMGQAYANNHTATFAALQCNSTAMASALGLKVGEMTGYAYGTEGYPSNLQPALAYSVASGGSAAWTVFMNRSVKPNYAEGAQFAIVPR